MATLPNALLAARPIGGPRVPVTPLGGAGVVVASARSGPKIPEVLPSAIRAARPVPASSVPITVTVPMPPAERPRGRITKEERARELRRSVSERIAAFADSKPSKKAVREFFAARIAELNEEKGV